MTDIFGGSFGSGANTCTDVCGTGGWNGPKPGDPDNNVLLSAVSAFGGIDVTWTMPATNPFAVAHTIVYRAQTRSFSAAIPIATVAGNFYFDTVDSDSPLEYSYWIQLVSINGTYGAVIGPATAFTRSRIADTIELLSGRINEGQLANSLRSKVDNIDTIGNNLTSEIQSRIDAIRSLGLVVDGVQQDALRAITFVEQEIINRTDSDSAIVGQINTLASAYDNQFAAILNTQTVLTDSNTALADQVNLIFTKSDQATAGIANIETGRIGYSVLRGTSTPFDGNKSTVVYPVDVYPSESYPQYAVDRTRIIDKVGVDLWNLTAAGQAKPAAWLVGLPLATAVKTVGVTGPNGEAATLEQAFTAQQVLNGQFKAQYTVKISVDQGGRKLVGGFGIYGDATGIEAGFDVNRFWIGSSTASSIKPFIVDNNIVYINDASINKLNFNKLRSDDGSLVFENGKLKANFLNVTKVTGGNYTSYTWPADKSNGFYLGPGGLLMGNAYNSRYFQLTDYGDLYAPNFKIENGVVTANGINITRTTAVNTGTLTGRVYAPNGSWGPSYGFTQKLVGLSEWGNIYEWQDLVVMIDTGIDDLFAVTDLTRPVYSAKVAAMEGYYTTINGWVSGKAYDILCKAEVISTISHYPTGVGGAPSGRFSIKATFSLSNLAPNIANVCITKIIWSLNKVT